MRLRSKAVSRLRAILTMATISAAVLAGGMFPGAGAVAASSGSLTIGSQTTPTPTTLAASDPAILPPRRTSTGTTRTVTRALIGIAAATAVMSVAYFWYTIPSRRERLAERRE